MMKIGGNTTELSELLTNGVNTTMDVHKTICPFYPQNLAENSYGLHIFVIFVPVLLVVSVLGLINNTLSYLVLQRLRTGKTPDFLLGILSIADNFVLISYVFYYTLPSLYEYGGSMEEYYEVFQYFKRYLWFFVWFSKTFSVYTTILLTLGRYVAICHPFKRLLDTRKRASIGIFIVLLFSLVYNLPKIWYVSPILEYDNCTDRYRPRSVYTSLSKNKYFSLIYVNLSYYLILYVLPLVLLSVLNILLFRTIRRARRFRSAMVRRQSEPLRNQKTTYRSDGCTERIIGVVTTFVVLETPAIIINSFAIVKILAHGPSLALDQDLVLYINRCTYVLSAINSFINFYIYCLVAKKFRETVLKIIFTRRYRKKKDWLPVSTASGIMSSSPSVMKLRLRVPNGSIPNEDTNFSRNSYSGISGAGSVEFDDLLKTDHNND